MEATISTEKKKNNPPFELWDKDGQYAKKQYIATGRKLIESGRKKDRVLQAMVNSAIEIAIESGGTEYLDFIHFLEKRSREVIGATDAALYLSHRKTKSTTH